MQNIGNVVNFNAAYYGALGGVERAELVLKYKSPGFEWSGGFLQSTTFGPPSDILSGGFGRLTSPNNGFAWVISSRTRTIPSSGNGNVDYLLANPDSKNYNQLPYFSSEKILFTTDTTNNPLQYYSGVSSFSYFSGWSFSWTLRLPPKIVSSFGWSLLCDNSLNPLCDIDGDGIVDDITVNWFLDWLINWSPFTILPTISVFYYSGMQIDTRKDIAIRKSIINETWNLYFGNYYGSPSQDFNPIDNYFPNNTLNQHNVISTKATAIQWSGFNKILSSLSITGLKLSMWLVTLLRSSNGNIYPFLEYNLSFPTPVADRFYTIQGIGLVGDYNVKIFIKKSTNEDNSIGDFTVIF